jgi:phosphonate transport system permease protein
LTNQSSNSISIKTAPGQLTILYAFLMDVFLWTYTSLVAYKIFYNKFILEERYPEFKWEQFFSCLIVGSLVALVLSFPAGWSVGKRSLRLYIRDLTLPAWKAPYFLLSWFFLIITFITGHVITQVSFLEFFSAKGFAGADRIFSALLNPNTAILVTALELAIETVYMAFMATAFAVPVAFIVAFFASRNLMKFSALGKLAYTLFRLITNITRSMEPIVWAIIFSVWVGIGPFAGMLALFVHSVASLVKLYSEQIEGISDGPIEAMTATGAHPIQVVWYGVVPQVVLPFLSYTIYRWDINVRMATVIGLVGGGGIGTLLMQYSQAGKWNETGLLALVIFVIVWIMDYASAKIREAIK